MTTRPRLGLGRLKAVGTPLIIAIAIAVVIAALIPAFELFATHPITMDMTR